MLLGDGASPLKTTFFQSDSGDKLIQCDNDMIRYDEIR